MHRRRAAHIGRAGAAAQWKPTADQLVREGVTSKDPDVVAAILAEHAAGTPPSTIGRRQNVHHGAGEPHSERRARCVDVRGGEPHRTSRFGTDPLWLGINPFRP